MKKLIIAIITALLLCSCGKMKIVGNQYIVTSVKDDKNIYELKYKIEIRSLHERSSVNTWDGNKFTMYTDELYMVGDTLTII